MTGVSLVIAAYNAENSLRRAIGSALAQTRPPREVIVVDDGSTDDTAEVAGQCGSNVKLVRQPNAGPGAARNRGAREAVCDNLVFLDADDELLPHMIECLESSLERFPSSAVASGAHLSNNCGATVRVPKRGSVLGGRTAGVLADFFDAARRHHVVCVGSVLVRRRAFVEAGGFREDVRFGEDLDLWARLAGRGDWLFVDEPVMVYHRTASSSATVRTPESAKPVDYLMNEQRLTAYVRPELRRSYRRYRRDLLLRQAHGALDQRATRQALNLLRAIPPAPMNWNWAVTAVLARSQPLASLAMWSIQQVRRVLRRPYAY